jgi:DNA-directed RNA polymerase subunit RPC12/RpoP
MAVSRHYICDHCNHTFIAEESIKKTPRKKCPKCHKLALYQDLTGAQPPIITQEPTTLGQQAERNSKAMGKWGLEAQERKDKEEYNKRKNAYLKKQGVDQTVEEIKKTWYNPEGKNLKAELKDVIKDEEKTKKYILTGEK